MEIAGCTGKKKQARKQGEEETGAEEEVFFLKYIKFYFLNEGYFGYFLELLGAPAILLGAPSNTLNKGVGTDNNGLEVRIVQID